MEHFLRALLLLMILTACGHNAKDIVQSTEKVPELVLVDSLVVDRLTGLSLVDINNDRSRYLFYDSPSKELILTDGNGDILKIANRSGEGDQSYQMPYFFKGQLLEDNRILIRSQKGNFFYDEEFSLLAKSQSPYEVVTDIVSNNDGLIFHGDYTFVFGYDRQDEGDFLDEFSPGITAYPVIRVYFGDSLFKSVNIPEEVNLVSKPGRYATKNPKVKLVSNELLMLFPTNPTLFRFSFPELDLLERIPLNPILGYKEIQPAPADRMFHEFNEFLRGSFYVDFIYSNGNLLTYYMTGVADHLVDALPKDEIGGEKWSKLWTEHKKPVYQVYSARGTKLIEAEWPVKLQTKRDVLYTVNVKPGEERDAVEKDVQTIYFYELK